MTELRPPPDQTGLFGEGLTKSFSGREVVSGVDVEVRPRAIVCLLGPSGSGKTSIFRMLAGMDRPDQGVVTIDGRDVRKLAIDGRARLGLGYVPQASSLFADLTAEDNLRIALEARHPDAATRERVLGIMLAWFGIEPVRRMRVGTLSGGQRKLVDIAYAVSALPRYLLLDEPFTGLDPIMVETIGARIRAIAASGVGVLLTDHKARSALNLAHRAVVIEAGRIIADGDPAEVARVARVRTAFLGENFRLASPAEPEPACAT